MIPTTALTLVMALSARAADPAPGALPAADDATFADAAVLIGLTGSGVVTVAGQDPVRLERCATLPLGATVCTDAGSFATLRLAPTPDALGAEDVVMLPGTCVNIEAATAGRRQLAIEQGSVSVAPHDGGSSTLAIRSGEGVTEGGEGGFRVTLEDTATRTEAVFGAVTLTGEGGALDLAAGKGSRLRPDAPPDPPTDLLVAETLTLPTPDTPLRRPDFSWEAVPYATGYRVELAANAEFTDIVEAIDLADAFWFPDLLFSPTRIPGLWWRIAAYDRFGFLGVPTDAWRINLPGGVGG